MGKHHHKKIEKPIEEPKKDEPVKLDATEQPRKHIDHVYITVDACAQLGGQPYIVLEKLKKMNDLTHVRKTIEVIDTEQGFHEKSNYTVPEFIMDRPTNGKYANFLKRNPEWTNIVRTPACEKFREDLAAYGAVEIAQPLMAAAERMEKAIQKEAFKLLKERTPKKPRMQPRLFDKPINRAKDIQIRISAQGSDPLAFDHEVLHDAAANLMPQWEKEMAKIGVFNENEYKDSISFMLKVLKGAQRIKGYSYILTNDHNKFDNRQYDCIPGRPGPLPTTFDEAEAKSHMFSYVKVPTDPKWWEKSEVIQAWRMTDLWPWSIKAMLNEDATAKLKAIHFNTADTSYLQMFTNVMPERVDPASSMHILLTHDGPLIQEFLECTTGVHREVAMTKKAVRAAKAVGEDLVYEHSKSNIYQQRGLIERDPYDYPIQRSWAGSEFCKFVYKEVLAALKDKIPEERRKALFEETKVKSPVRVGTTVHDAILAAVMDAQPLDEKARQAMVETLAVTLELEEFIRKDIEKYGAAENEKISFHYRQKEMLRERQNLALQ